MSLFVFICKNKGENNMEDEKKKSQNATILISGAILIVLSAIVFLLSTWNTMSNFVKTGILVLLIGVFLEASAIAKKVFKLEQASKAFYYIAMAYIPIVVLAMSLFGLLGNYLSIFGEGKYLFFSISNVILSIIYLLEYARTKRKPLIFFSLATQLLSAIYIGCIFNVGVNNNTDKYIYDLMYNRMFNNIKLAVIIYSIALTIVCKMVDLKSIKLEGIKIYNLVLSAIVGFGTIRYLPFMWISSQCTAFDCIILGLLFLHSLLLQKDYKKMYIGSDLLLVGTVITITCLQNLVMPIELRILIISAFTIGIYIREYFKANTLKEKTIYKTICYCLIHLIIYSIIMLLNLKDLVYFVPLASTLIAIFLEAFNKNKNIKYYIIVSFGISFLAILFKLIFVKEMLPTYIILIISMVLYSIYVSSNKMTKEFMIMPMICIMPAVYISKALVFGEYNYNIIVSVFLIGITTIKSLKNKKFDENTIFSFIYILATILAFKIYNYYIANGLILLWSIAHAFEFRSKKTSGLFRALAYIVALILYNRFIWDIKIAHIAVMRYLGYMLVLYLITRTVIGKKTVFYKVIEYIGTSLIYIIALNHYLTIGDAMAFILFILAMTIVGYSCSIGPLFLVSIIAVIANFFQLTQVFWTSIPWWAYMLTVGAGLITFAVVNEAKGNSAKQNFKKYMQKIKQEKDL